MLNRISLPQGVKDYTPDKAEELRRVEDNIMNEFGKWGYRKVITPLFEYASTLSTGLGEELRDKILKFVDPSTGYVVALRPDITPQISRIVATQLKEHTFPLRLCYNGRVVRFEEKSSGKEREMFQVGCELIGSSYPDADGEIIALAVKSLEKSGIKKLVLDIGHTGLLRSLLEQTGDARKEIEEAIRKKDEEALSEALNKSKASSSIKKAIGILPSISGNGEVLKRAKEIRSISKYVKELERVLMVLDDYQLDCDINVDLAELRGFNYYSGVAFEIMSKSAPTPMIRGGRYDSLIGKYGYEVPATGFALDLESILSFSKQNLENNKIHFMVIPKKPSLKRKAIRLAEWLRSSNFKVVVDLNLSPEQIDTRIKNNRSSNFYGVILLETPRKLKLLESQKGAGKEFSDIETFLTGVA